MKRLIALIAMLGLLAAPAFADDCVEIDFEAEPEIHVGVVYFFYGEVINCSDEAGEVFFSLTLEFEGMSYDLPEFARYLGAGETISGSFPIVVPPIFPEGDVTITITATKGDATDTETINLTVVHPNGDDAMPRKGELPNRLENENAPSTVGNK